MTEILISATSSSDILEDIQAALGGEIQERWGESVLTINNNFATGTFRHIPFDWGVNLFEYDIKFHKKASMVLASNEFNPIRFIYCLQGHCFHRFGYEDDIRKLEQFQSVIITSRDGGVQRFYFPENEKLEINVIQIVRKEFLKKRHTVVDSLNKELYEVFLDTDHERNFVFLGTYNLKLATQIGKLRKVRQKGLIRILLIEGMIYQILCMHIIHHKNLIENQKPQSGLLKRELKKIRELANRISNHISRDYALDELAAETGLSQAKLQKGFKHLYARTVTDYIRHTRLEAARDLIKTTELNISQIVYTIGFSSRSYFSKIFKEKYQISPSTYLKKSRKKPHTLVEGK
jgi:AraC-like DNA-binding protein